MLFTYLHLATDFDITEKLIKTGCVAIAYETVSDERGGLPLLAPMSEVAGQGQVTCRAVAEDQKREFIPAGEAITD